MKPEYRDCRDCACWLSERFCIRRPPIAVAQVGGDAIDIASRIATGWPETGPDDGCFDSVAKEVGQEVS